MEVYLIRHTTPKVDKGICYGQTDLDVADTFDDELGVIQQTLGDFNDVVVYTSPLKRCAKLANQIASKQPIVDARLMEMDFGDWEMQAWNDINQTDLNIWMDDFVNEICPQGESYRLLYQRVMSFVDELKIKNIEKVAIVTHAGVIRSIRAHYEKIDLVNSFDIKIEYGDVHRFEL